MCGVEGSISDLNVTSNNFLPLTQGDSMRVKTLTNTVIASPAEGGAKQSSG